MITKSLASAICDLVVKESVASTVEEIEKRAGERGIVSRRSVLNILHREGEGIRKAQEERAKAVFEAMPEGRCLIIERNARGRKWAGGGRNEGGWELEEEEVIGRRVIWNWESGQITYYEQRQLREADGLVIVQLDEVRVDAQAVSSRKELWIYTGVVNASGRSYYFTADSAYKLFYQVGALLAVLGVHKGEREVYVVGDGARSVSPGELQRPWIRNWYRDLPIGRKTMVLCWFHLTSTCHELLSRSFGREAGREIEKELLKHLWRGDVAGAIEELSRSRDKVVNMASFRRIVRYLRARWPYNT